MPKSSRRPGEKESYTKYLFQFLNLLRSIRFFVSATRQASFKFDYLTGNYVVDLHTCIMLSCVGRNSLCCSVARVCLVCVADMLYSTSCLTRVSCLWLQASAKAR